MYKVKKDENSVCIIFSLHTKFSFNFVEKTGAHHFLVQLRKNNEE